MNFLKSTNVHLGHVIKRGVAVVQTAADHDISHLNSCSMCNIPVVPGDDNSIHKIGSISLHIEISEFRVTLRFLTRLIL